MGIVEFYSKKSDLVLHVNDQAGEVRQLYVESAIEEKSGVVNTEFTENRPHLILVSFNPDETN